ncbi:MAG: hypothetical protein H0Z35_02675 [Thermoanaerobacteraceae bacterium]|nr:hypothetical protein [Thermoanaerobacteraceae bacterium]
MAWLFGIGLVLVLIFSISVSLYIINYKLSVKGNFTKTLLFLIFSTVTFGVVSGLVIFLVWPPHIWDLISF